MGTIEQLKIRIQQEHETKASHYKAEGASELVAAIRAWKEIFEEIGKGCQ